MTFPGIIPSLLPDETVLSWLYRFSLLNVWGMKATSTQLVGRIIQPPWLIPSGLNRLAAFMPPTMVGGVEQLIADHTLYPLFRPFLSADDRAAAMAVMRTTKTSASIFMRLGIVRSVSRFGSGLKLCLDCVNADLGHYGSSYWHRIHQIPGLTVCAHHGSPLLTGCGQCAMSEAGGRSARLPGLRCWCGNSMKSNLRVGGRDGQTKSAKALADLCAEILSWEPIECSPKALFAAFAIQVRKIGYANGSRVSSRVYSDFTKYWGASFLEMRGDAVERSGGWINALLSSPGKIKDPLRNLLLAGFLFGSSHAFRNALGEAEATPEFDSGIKLGRWLEDEEIRTKLPAWFNEHGGVLSAVAKTTGVKAQHLRRIGTELGLSWRGANMTRDTAAGRNGEILAALQAGRTVPYVCAKYGISMKGLEALLSQNIGRHADLRPVYERLRVKRTREQITSYLLKHPSTTRKQLERDHPSLFRFSRDVDGAWLDRRILRQNGNANRPHKRPSRGDRELCETIQKIARQLFAIAGRPRRVTASRIARELPQGRALLAGTAHSKRAQKLLLAEAESSTLYKERLARWFFLHPPTGVPQKELLGFINQKTNIRIGRLNELVGLWISEKSMSRMKAA